MAAARCTMLQISRFSFHSAVMRVLIDRPHSAALRAVHQLGMVPHAPLGLNPFPAAICPLPTGDYDAASALEAADARYAKLKARFRELEAASVEEIEELQEQLEEAAGRIQQLEARLAQQDKQQPARWVAREGGDWTEGQRVLLGRGNRQAA